MPGDVIRRTAITRLSVSPSQEALLQRTIEHWREACQIAVNAGWPTPRSKGALQRHAYDRIRADTPLGSQHAILATHRAYEAIKSVHGQPGETATKPTFTAPTVTYDPWTMSLFDDASVSLTTVDDRVRCDLVLASDDTGYQSRFLEDPSWSLAESTLCYRSGAWFLHRGFRRPRPPMTATENGTVLGVDLGIDNIP